MAISWDSGAENETENPVGSNIVWDSGASYDPTQEPEATPDKAEAAPAAPPEKPSYMQGLAKGVAGGMIGAGIGAAQLAGKFAGYLIPGEDPEWLNTFNQNALAEEAKRRELTEQYKEEYGRPGIMNPVSQGEFLGENAPLMAASSISGAQAATSLLPKSWLATVGEGAAIGAGLGAVQPVVEGESRFENVVKSGVGGAIIAPVARVVTSGVSKAAEKTSNKIAAYMERRAMKDVDREAAALMEGTNAIIDRNLRKVAPSTPSEIQTPEALARRVKNDHAAIDTIAQMRDEVKFIRDGREVSNTLPKTLNEALSATTRTKEKIADWINDITTHAGNSGMRVDVNSVIGELQKITNAAGYSRAQRTTAQNWLEDLAEIQANGGYSVPSAIRAMSGLNNDIKALFTGANKSGDSPEVLGLIASKFRNVLNETLESAEGAGQFGELRRQLGNLMSLERRFLKTVEREANREAKNSLSIFDIIGAEQVIRGAARANPTGLAEGAASYAVGKATKMLRNPDRSIRKIFDTAEYLNRKAGSPRMASPSLPKLPEQLPAPALFKDPSTGKVRSAGDYRK